MRPVLSLLVLLLAGLIHPGPLHAVQPHEMLDDPALEARARDLSTVIRCLVCQNQSIDESDAELAADLRVLVRERLTAGDSDQAVLDFLVDRYGDFVLLKPPFKPGTYVLYFGPAVFLILALVGAALYFRRRRTEVSAAAGGVPAVEAPLSRDEQSRLDRILAGDDNTK